MAALVLSIAFTEASAPKVIKQLCLDADLPESEPNAKLALKKLAVEVVTRGLIREAREKAELEPKVE